VHANARWVHHAALPTMFTNIVYSEAMQKADSAH
jgi:hypothetical protein